MRIENSILLSVTDSDIPSDGIFVIPNSVIVIGKYAFYGCTSLKQVTLPKGLTEIGSHAFWNCHSLAAVTLPKGLTKIGRHAFCGCCSIKSISIPNSITKIKYYAFSDCSSLTSITIPNSVTSIEYDAFDMCTSLTSVNDLPCKCIDGYPMIITSQKQVSEYTIYRGYDVNKINFKEKTYFYVAEKDGFTAHGKTAKKAIEDLNFKIARYKLAKDPIYLDTVMTIVHYRAITGACSFGVNKWLKEHNIKESDKLTVRELLPILEKTNAYGLEQFKKAIKDI